MIVQSVSFPGISNTVDMVKQTSKVPSDLYPIVYKYLISNDYPKSAKSFLKDINVKVMSDTKLNLGNLYKSYIGSIDNKKVGEANCNKIQSNLL